MKLLVCGGRTFGTHSEAQFAFVLRVLDELHAMRRITSLIHGAARGADNIAGQWARTHGVKEIRVPAQWQLLGRAAGRARNIVMLDLHPQLLVAFPGGNGTAHMVGIALDRGIEAYVYSNMYDASTYYNARSAPSA